jgi:hypothetical protein
MKPYLIYDSLAAYPNYLIFGVCGYDCMEDPRLTGLTVKLKAPAWSSI